MRTGQARLPRLLRRALDGTGKLAEAGRLRPSSLWAEMNLTPLCRAGMTLEEDDLPVGIHDLVEIFGQNGSLGVFRVASVERVCGQKREVLLNHALDLFSDVTLPGEPPEKETAAQALARIVSAQTETLNGQPYWALGTAAEGENRYAPQPWANAMEYLTEIAGAEEDCRLAFDFSSFPWRLDFVPLEEGVATEFRLSRNVESCRVTLDDSKLCTRLYLSVETEGATAVETYEDAAAQALWGVVSRTAGVNAADVPDRAAWARRYFERHGQPGARIDIDGFELNRLTGERLDETRLGRLCRVALPDYGAVFRERVVSLRYPDLLAEPERVRVSLANRQATAAGLFSALSARAGATERTLRSTSRVVVNHGVSLIAHDRHITEQGEILHAAGLEIDPHGTWLFAAEQGTNTALGARFSVQADAIGAVVAKTGVNSLGENETLYSLYRQTAEEIELRAKTITLTALQTKVNNLMTGVSTAQSLRVTNLVVKGHGCDWFTVRADNGIFRLLGYYDE